MTYMNQDQEIRAKALELAFSSGGEQGHVMDWMDRSSIIERAEWIADYIKGPPEHIPMPVSSDGNQP